MKLRELSRLLSDTSNTAEDIVRVWRSGKMDIQLRRSLYTDQIRMPRSDK
jgi:hypothetical protein